MQPQLPTMRFDSRQQELAFPEDFPVLAPVLKDFIKGPIFAPRSQKGARAICIDGNFWTIGVEHPIERWCNKSLSIKHGRICFALLAFWRQQGYTRSLRFTIGELCRLYSNSTAKGGRYYRDLLELLFDLRDTWVQIAHPNGATERFTIIGDIKIVENTRGSMQLERVDLSPEFFNLLSAIESLAYIRLDVLNAIASPIAASIYTFLPSRAYHHTPTNPFQINLATLIGQIGLEVPPTKSQRQKIFTQNSSKKNQSILQQLDGIALTNGALHVKIAECVAHEDYKLLAWVEKDSVALPYAARGKLYEAWCASGKTESEYRERMHCAYTLSDYEEALLERCGIEIKSMRCFLERAKTLIGPMRFQETLAEIKADKLEDKTPRKNYKAKLIHSLMSVLKGG